MKRRNMALAAIIAASACDSQAEPLFVDIESIEIISPAFTIDAGRSALVEFVTRDRNGDVATGARINWTSSDTTIARIDDTGTVTGVSAGTVTIKAAAGLASDRTQVRVSQDGVYPNAIRFDGTHHNIGVGRVAMLRPRTEPFLNGARLRITSSDPQIASADSVGNVTGLRAGTVVVTATWVNDMTVTAHATVTVIQALSND